MSTASSSTTPSPVSNEPSVYLVTGASGFLGGTVCRQLVARGARVRAFVMPGDPGARYLDPKVEVVEGDLTDAAALARFLDVPGAARLALIHCASIVTVDPDYNQKVMDVNVGGTKNVIEACLASAAAGMPVRLVHVSSTGAIPELPAGARIAEVDRFDPEATPELVLGCYSQSKALATQAVLDAVRERGLDACVVHPSGIMGPEDYAMGETTSTLVKIINGQMPMGIDGTFNLCDVRDLAAGCLAAVERGRAGECYILANRPVTFKEFSRLVAAEANCKPPRLFLPCSVASALARVMERRAQKSGKKPLLTSFSVYNLARNNDFDSSKAERELGYTTRTYEETMRDEVAWLRRAGKLGDAR